MFLSIPLPAYGKGDLPGEVLATFKDEGEEFPAMTMEGGTVYFNFDPEETLSYILREEYSSPNRPLTSLLPFHYHKVPPALRVLLGKLITRHQERKSARRRFPRPHFEPVVEALRDVCQKVLLGITRRDYGWHSGKKAAAIIFHDVDTLSGYKNIKEFREIEKSHGLKSVWNLVGAQIPSHESHIELLRSDGCEIALHGYNHDNRFPFLSEVEMRRRLDSLCKWLERYSIKGFRSPSLYRTPLMFHVICEYFDWDSSLPDTEFGKGCCTVFPFHNGDVIEIPLTLTMDSTYILCGKSPEEILSLWKRKIEVIYNIGGLITLTTHPEPHFSGNTKMLKLYEDVLNVLMGYDSLWFCLPGELLNYLSGE